MKYLLFYFLILCGFQSYAADGMYKAGSRAASMGNAATISQDVWSVFHNPAGLAFLKTAEAGISYEKRFSLKELSTNSLAVAIPLGKTGVIGFNAVYFGFKNYYEEQAGICYAKRFSNKFSGSVKLNFQSVKIGEDYGSKNAVTAEAGLQVMPVRNLWIGTHIYNPTQTKLTNSPKENLPSVFNLGAGYFFSEKFSMQASAEKNSNKKTSFSGGIEYHPMKQLWFRTGITTQPYTYNFGFGFLVKDFQFDFATGVHPQLGLTPNLSLVYHFTKK